MIIIYIPKYKVIFMNTNVINITVAKATNYVKINIAVLRLDN